jgi:hypothetical protein
MDRDTDTDKDMEINMENFNGSSIQSTPENWFWCTEAIFQWIYRPWIFQDTIFFLREGVLSSLWEGSQKWDN